MNNLGAKIRMIRKEKGITQEELAGDKITRSQLSQIENGVAKPSLSTLEYIASKLSIPTWFFLDENSAAIESCKALLNKTEKLMANEQYHDIIDELENFVIDSKRNSLKNNNLLHGKILAVLGIAYYHLDNDKCALYLEEATKLLMLEAPCDYLYKSLKLLGNHCYKNKEYSKMEHYLTLANNFVQKVTLDNVLLKIDIMYNLSLALYLQKKWHDSSKIIFQAISFTKKYKIFHNLGEMYMLLELIYSKSFDYKESICYIKKAIEYFNLIDDHLLKYMCFINLGFLYRAIRDFDNSLLYLDEALEYFKSTNYTSKYHNCLTEKIKTMFMMSDQRHQVYSMAAGILKHLDYSPQNKGDILVIQAVLDYENGIYDRAFDKLKEAELLLANCKEQEFLPYLYSTLSSIYKLKGDNEKAFTYLSKSNEFNFTKKNICSI